MMLIAAIVSAARAGYHSSIGATAVSGNQSHADSHRFLPITHHSQVLWLFQMILAL